MAAIDDLMPDYHSGAGVMTRRCTLCEHCEVWRRIYRNAEHNRREGSRARAKMLQHIKAEHPDAYAVALERNRQERAQRAEARARWQEERARMTPYELGSEAFLCSIRAAERHNVPAGMLDNCPFKKGTPEEAEYDRGWQAARQQHAAVSG
jgi:ferredoxin-NADP reductase